MSNTLSNIFTTRKDGGCDGEVFIDKKLAITVSR